MRTSFYNTSEAVHPELGQYEHKAKNQETIILDWFRSYEQQATPSKLHKLLFHDHTPLTSVRRSLTNLVLKGELEKTDIQIMGPYGRPEFVWKLARGQRDLF